MRDRLVALGMRRPTRIEDENFDVPMLVLEDFEIEASGSDKITIQKDCVMIRDVSMQKDLAMMCIAMAKLCLCIGHVLSAQHAGATQGHTQSQKERTGSSAVLRPGKLVDKTDELRLCDAELAEWIREVNAVYRYVTPTEDEIERGASPFLVQRALLHMFYYATVTTLHRPQVVRLSKTVGLSRCNDLQEVSAKTVQEASMEIARMSLDLHNVQLDCYLPTTGVTVLLLAITTHLLLLNIESFSSETHEEAWKGLCQCMQVLGTLRDNYAAADYSMRFLETAIRQSDIDVATGSIKSKSVTASPPVSDWVEKTTTHSYDRPQVINDGPVATLILPTDDLLIIDNETSVAKPALIMSCTSSIASATTQPSSEASTNDTDPVAASEGEQALQSDSVCGNGLNLDEFEYEKYFDALINFNNDESSRALEEGVYGEHGVYSMDIDLTNYADNL
jgi:hypothetical protein